MPKVKTHSGAKKRFKKTGTGRIKISKSFRRHLLTGKRSKRKRQLRTPGYINSVDQRHILPLLPY